MTQAQKVIKTKVGILELVTACPGFVAELPQSSVEGQPTGGRLIVSSRVLLTGPFCPGS